MIIANRSIHIIDYENNRILSRDIPATFDEYVGELIEHINRNDSVRDYKTRSRYTEVISGAIAISSQKDNVVSKTGDYATMLLGDLKKNLIAIFGFLFTVILANIVSDQPLQNIFTREITVILEVVIAGSVIYLIICHIESQYKLCKIKRTYYLLKDNYKGLLSDVDLQESFNGDKIITDTVRSVERGIWIYTIIWFVFLIVLLLILEHISSSPVITIWINNAVSFFHEIAKSGAH